METFKIRVKVGNHEFEAEGSQEAVERQFQMFKELVGTPAVIPLKNNNDSIALSETLALEPPSSDANGGSNGGERGGIDRKRIPGRGQCDQPGPGPQGAACRQPRRAGRREIA